MALVKLSDFDSDYQNSDDDADIKGSSVYVEGDEKIGTVDDILVDEVTGQFRYLIVDLGFWIFGKKVLLPIGRARVDQNNDRIYANYLTKDQAEHLPEFKDDMAVDYDHEENVRNVYRQGSYSSTMGNRAETESVSDIDMAGTSSSMGLTDTPTDASYNRDSYSYDRDPSLYAMNDRDHQTLKLYEERLVANKSRVKTGDVRVGKRVETETVRASVPVEKERVVIERSEPGSTDIVSPGDVDFQEGEVARIEVYEETPDIRKEAFVREEVRVRKEVDNEVVNAEETIRREQLDVDSQGHTIDDRRL